MAIQSINPATGEVLDTFPETSPRNRAQLADGHDAFLAWRARPFAERAARMREAARLLRERKDELARTMTLEMGKPIAQAEAEVEKCAWACDYYAEHAEALPRRPSRARPTPRGASCASSRSGPCSRSCRGTSPSGRCSASPRRR